MILIHTNQQHGGCLGVRQFSDFTVTPSGKDLIIKKPTQDVVWMRPNFTKEPGFWKGVSWCLPLADLYTVSQLSPYHTRQADSWLPASLNSGSLYSLRPYEPPCRLQVELLFHSEAALWSPKGKSNSFRSKLSILTICSGLGKEISTGTLRCLSLWPSAENCHGPSLDKVLHTWEAAKKKQSCLRFLKRNAQTDGEVEKLGD